jgi:hypothetical protein
MPIQIFRTVSKTAESYARCTSEQRVERTDWAMFVSFVCFRFRSHVRVSLWKNFGWGNSGEKAKAKFRNAVLRKARTICAAIHEIKLSFLNHLLFIAVSVVYEPQRYRPCTGGGGGGGGGNFICLLHGRLYIYRDYLLKEFLGIY